MKNPNQTNPNEDKNKGNYKKKKRTITKIKME